MNRKDSEMNKKRTPSKEEFERAFARASAAMDKKNRGLSEVTEKILNRFEELHHFMLFCTDSEYSFCALIPRRFSIASIYSIKGVGHELPMLNTR